MQPCGTYTTPALSHPAIAMQSTVTCIQHSEPYAISAHTDIPPSEPCSTCPVSVLPTKRSQSPHHEGQLRLPILHCYAVTLPQHATSVSFRTAAPRKTLPRQAQGSLDNPKPTTSADKCSLCYTYPSHHSSSVTSLPQHNICGSHSAIALVHTVRASFFFFTAPSPSPRVAYTSRHDC